MRSYLIKTSLSASFSYDPKYLSSDPKYLLGFTIQMRRGAKIGKPYPNVRPSDKSLEKIKARLTKLTRRELTVIPLNGIVGNVNRSLRGWVNYFHYRNSSQVMGKVRRHAEDRLRTHLRKRYKVKNRRSDVYVSHLPTSMGATGYTRLLQ